MAVFDIGFVVFNTKVYMRFKKITTRIVVTVMPVVFISTIAMSLVSYFVSKNRINTETALKTQALLANEASKIQCELNNAVGVANSMGRYAEIADKDVFTSGIFEKYMEAAVTGNNGIVDCGIWFEPHATPTGQQHFALFYSRKDDVYRLNHFYTNHINKYENSKWYLRGRAAKSDLVWGDVVFDEISGLTVLRAIRPLKDNAGRFSGVCTVDINIIGIRRIIMNSDLQEGEYMLLVSNDGSYVFSSYEHRPVNMKITDEFIPEVAAFGHELLLNEKGECRIELKGVVYRIYYQIIPGVNWKIALAVPEAAMFASAHSLITTMLIITVAALLVMSLAIMLITRHLHTIIAKINRFSTLAAAGHLNERITVASVDEFGTIAKNLNTMLESTEHMTRAKGEFLSRMSHEIRTPMNAIIGMTQIGRHTNDYNKREECLIRIEENSNHLLGIINDILDYSKIDSGKLVLDSNWVSIRQNTDFIFSMLKSRADGKGLDFQVLLDNIEHDCVKVDALRLNQVLINFLSNAIKFTDAGGKIELTINELMAVGEESVYKFSVKDTGIGIDPLQIKKLFTPFSQANAGISRNYGGTGLGLVISKSIVEMMGGDIELETAPGKGSVFSFTIRLMAQKALPPMQKSPDGLASDAVPDFSRFRILIVDDIEINRVIAMEFLEASGVTMECAENGQDAVNIYMEKPAGYYDMIFMDMLMPVMDGCTATRMIRAAGKADSEAIKIIAMTANVLQEDVKRVFDAGMNGHIGKPVNVKEMFRVMGESLLYCL